MIREDYGGRRVVVVGLAATGRAVARFLHREGALVTVSESRPAGSPGLETAGLPEGVAVELGGNRPETFAAAELIVPSPGVPRDLEVLQAASRRGVPVLSEVELAFRSISRPMLAVTGTNGKTTTVSLLSAMLAAGGHRAPAVGNIGTPLISMAGRDDDFDCLAVEISSFQLEWVERFAPRGAAILNVTADHLDRYRDFDDYRDTKLRIAAAQGPDEVLVLNRDDGALREVGAGVRPRLLWFSHAAVRPGVFRDGQLLWANLGKGPTELLDVRELLLVGVHNQENVMAAAALALDYGVEVQAVRDAALAFRGLPHRNELVAEARGVRWYDDSKGTNVGAVVKSLESFEGPVILIAGGREKGGSYIPLADEVARKVKLLVLIGEARARMKTELGRLTETAEASTMEDAVGLAAAAARPGDTVLLSPACSSFDMFRDYHHRGQVYREAVGRVACPAS